MVKRCHSFLGIKSISKESKCFALSRNIKIKLGKQLKFSNFWNFCKSHTFNFVYSSINVTHLPPSIQLICDIVNMPHFSCWLTIFTPCNLCLFIFYLLIDMLILYLLHSILLILYSVHVHVCINVRKTLKIYKITCRNSKLWHVFFTDWFFILWLILLTKCI